LSSFDWTQTSVALFVKFDGRLKSQQIPRLKFWQKRGNINEVYNRTTAIDHHSILAEIGLTSCSTNSDKAARHPPSSKHLRKIFLDVFIPNPWHLIEICFTYILRH